MVITVVSGSSFLFSYSAAAVTAMAAAPAQTTTAAVAAITAAAKARRLGQFLPFEIFCFIQAGKTAGIHNTAVSHPH